MSKTAIAPLPAPRRAFMPRALPYLLSLPALLACVGILVPFVTAVVYSMERYNLSMPYLRGFVWFKNYVGLFTDPDFWNTIEVSLIYTVSTVVFELLLGLGIALLLRERTRSQQRHLHRSPHASDDGTRHRCPHVEADDEPRLRCVELVDLACGIDRFQVGVEPAFGDVHCRSGGYLGLHALHDDPASCGATLASAAAVRSGATGWRQCGVRLSADYLANADALPLHRSSVSHFGTVYSSSTSSMR